MCTMSKSKYTNSKVLYVMLEYFITEDEFLRAVEVNRVVRKADISSFLVYAKRCN